MELYSLSDLVMLDLENNRLEGQLFIPALLNRSDTLTSLRGSNNNFTGSIPSWIGAMTMLREFWVANNKLTGSIPTEITQLTNLGMFFQYNCNY
jgi:Leucine-rich repeat (LRR) protein